MEAQEQGGSCFARMLDIRSYILAAQAGMLGARGAGSVLVLMVLFGAIGLCLLPLWISFDLASTWGWATGTQSGSADAVAAIAAHADRLAPANATIMNMTIGQAVSGMITVGITLLPTLFELAFPSLRHPMAMLVLNAAILFDYVTDWGTSWAATAAWSGADNWFWHFCWTACFNLFVSVGVQAVLVLCVTMVVFGALRLVSGPVKRASAGVVVLPQ